MKRIFLTPLLLLSAIALGMEFEPKQLKAEISTKGARAVLLNLWQEEESFNRLCSKVESGSEEWLQIAQLLRPASDAAATLSLNYSVARALPRNPKAVLRLIGKGFSTEDVCTSPFIEPEPGVAEAYEKKALRALASIRAPELVKVRDECASHIRLPSSKASY